MKNTCCTVCKRFCRAWTQFVTGRLSRYEQFNCRDTEALQTSTRKEGSKFCLSAETLASGFTPPLISLDMSVCLSAGLFVCLFVYLLFVWDSNGPKILWRSSVCGPDTARLVAYLVGASWELPSVCGHVLTFSFCVLSCLSVRLPTAVLSSCPVLTLDLASFRGFSCPCRTTGRQQHWSNIGRVNSYVRLHRLLYTAT